MKILYLIPRLDHSGAGQQLTLLVQGLPAEIGRCVCALGPEGPLAGPLRTSASRVEALGWRRKIDPRPAFRLRRLLQEFRPDLIHVWQPLALRFLLLAAGKRGKRLVFSGPSVAGKEPGALDCRLWRAVDRCVAQGIHEEELFRRAGIDAGKLVSIPPGVGAHSAPPESIPALPLSAGDKLLVCVGPFERHKGHHDAAWALDIVRFVRSDVHLALVGEGPDRERIDQFIRGSIVKDRAHFLGVRDDLAQVLGRADAVLIPGRRPGGINTALQAMAAGKPVIAGNVPGLAEIVLDGQTGLLFPPGDQSALARHVQKLVDDPELARRLGEAGRRRAAEHFPVSALVSRTASLYESICRK